MRKENLVPANSGDVQTRLTRSRAAALGATGLNLPVEATLSQNQKKHFSNENRKRTASDDKNKNAPKRRAPLGDVTNLCCKGLSKSTATKKQAKNSKKVSVTDVQKPKADLGDNDTSNDQVTSGDGTKVLASIDVENLKPVADFIGTSLVILDGNLPSVLNTIEENDADDDRRVDSNSAGMPKPVCSSKKAPGLMFSRSSTSVESEFINIDSNTKDPQLCSLYVQDIYHSVRVIELKRNLYPNFMEKVQRDLTHSMRGILVDWLVEVSEEYKLVPDTLYLTVYLIDSYLSHNYIERQKLQLLGITCMLIASKFEEISPPRVEEFCFITDNTYTKDEVLKMEVQVLKHFRFQIYAPTSKTFIRRYLRAAQVFYTSPNSELEYLANYLAELTLIEYGLLKFLPSVIAASAVFLARWTLDQSTHPWNPTLEYHTKYKASDLKESVLRIQDLQLNTTGCPLNAIRMKYRQEKYKSVAALSSPKLPEMLF